jgi:hypothetical protein
MARGDNFRGKKPEGSGRQKGSVTKGTANLREKYGAEMDKAFARVLDIANNSPDEEIAIRATATVMPYIYAKLSAISLEQDKDAEPTTINVRFIEPTAQPDGE